MANNYCQGSGYLPLREDQLEQAQQIINRVVDEFEQDDEYGYFGAEVEIVTNGVVYYHNESVDPDHVETLVQALVDELELNDPVMFSWAYTCSKARTDEFGGGAFVVWRGHETYWVDSQQMADDWIARQKGMARDL